MNRSILLILYKAGKKTKVNFKEDDYDNRNKYVPVDTWGGGNDCSIVRSTREAQILSAIIQVFWTMQ